VTGQPLEQRHFPPLEAQNVGAVLREETRPLRPVGQRHPLRVDWIERAGGAEQEAVAMPLALRHDDRCRPEDAVFDAPQRNRRAQVGKGADDRKGVGRQFFAVRIDERDDVEALAGFEADAVVVAVDNRKAPRLGNPAARIVARVLAVVVAAVIVVARQRARAVVQHVGRVLVGALRHGAVRRWV
jgi:hypothetical protein